MDTTIHLSPCVDRMKAEDDSARVELVEIAQNRLTALAHHMLRGFPGVARWEQADDVYQEATIRLQAALEKVEVADSTHFLRLAATQIRRQLIDLARKYQGPEGIGRWHYSQGRLGHEEQSSVSSEFEAVAETNGPQAAIEWTEFHESVEALPEQQRDVFDLLWYQGLQHTEAAELLGVDARTVRQHWRAARLALSERLQTPPSL